MFVGAGPVMSEAEAEAIDAEEEKSKFAFLNPEIEPEPDGPELVLEPERLELGFVNSASLEACIGLVDWSKD